MYVLAHCYITGSNYSSNTSKCGLRPYLLRFVAHQGLPTAGLGALCLENSSTNTPLKSLPVIDYLLITASHCWKSKRHIICWKEQDCGGGSRGGSRGGPVASFTRTTSNHSSLQRNAPRHAPIPNRMQLVWIHYSIK